MPLSRTMALSLVLGQLAVPMSSAQQVTDLVGDPQRGKAVFRSVASCLRCHGWPADGRTGVDMRAPTGSNLRESTLDKAQIAEVVACGRPGTAMPYHDRAAYRDGRCNGLVMSDFDSANEPQRGKSLSAQDIANVAVYLQDHVIGRGKPTFEECVDFFEEPAAKACSYMK